MISEKENLRKELSDLKKSFRSLIKANTELVDENKWLKKENEKLNLILEGIETFINNEKILNFIKEYKEKLDESYYIQR